MNKRSFSLVCALLCFALLAVTAGGCGGSSSHRSSNESKFAAALSKIIDNFAETAEVAEEDGKLFNVVNDILAQYAGTSSSDTNGIVVNVLESIRTGSSTVTSASFSGTLGDVTFEQRVNVDLTGTHFTSDNGKLTRTDGNSDFQLSITSNDHTTVLTITPSTNSYWKANTLLSAVLNEYMESKNIDAPVTLLFNKVPATMNITLTYQDNTSNSTPLTLLSGTVSMTASGTDVYENTTREDKFDLNLILHALNKTTINAAGSLSNTANSDNTSYTVKANTKFGNLLNFNSTIVNKVNAQATKQSDAVTATVSEFEAKVYNNLLNFDLIGGGDSINLSKLIDLYNRGKSTTEAQAIANAADINEIIQDNEIYVNGNANSTMRAFAGYMAGYDHVRIGLVFHDKPLEEPKLIRDIVEETELKKIKTMLTKVYPNLLKLLQVSQNLSFLDLSAMGINIDQEFLQAIFNEIFDIN